MGKRTPEHSPGINETPIVVSAKRAESIMRQLSRAVEHGAPRAMFDCTTGTAEVTIFPSGVVDKDAAREMIHEYADEFRSKTGASGKLKKDAEDAALRTFDAATPDKQAMFLVTIRDSLAALQTLPPKKKE